MDTFAVIQTGGKQYIVRKDDTLNIELIKDMKKDDKLVFDKVLMLVKDGNISLGKPFLEKTVVEGNVLEEIKGDKINILKFKAKSRYRKHKGHRQHYLKIKINKI
ncbi:50S ribosomal protein L21 [Patescibacteria group bacterium]|nr:50S ribosomal protein L21 [Patescibacteria group bacterium]